MKRLSARTIAYLILDLLLLVCCVLRLPDLQTRARAPFDLYQSGDSLFVTTILSSENCRELDIGDMVRQYAGVDLRTEHDLEFITDFKTIDEHAVVEYVRSGSARSTTVSLIPYFSLLYIIMVFAVGGTTLALAFFLLYKRPHDNTATILHWAFVSLGIVVILAWEGHTPRSVLVGSNSILFFVTYAGVAIMFLLFTTMFPRAKFGSVGIKTVFIFLPVAGVLLPLLRCHREALATHSLVTYGSYQDWFDVFHGMLIAYVIAGVLVFVHSYVTAGSQEERKKLKWILFGLCAGPSPFLLFTILPMTVAPRYIVPEYYTLCFLTAIPVSFAISFVRYHIFDIDVVINRTTVYAIVIGAMLALYAALVGVATKYVEVYTKESSIIAAVVVALLFQPVRSNVQRIIDRRFFRVHYNFREAERHFVEEVKHCLDLRQLADLAVRQIDELIPVERIGFFVLQQPRGSPRMLANRNFAVDRRSGAGFEIDMLATSHQLPMAIGEHIEAGIQYVAADKEVFRRWGLAAVFPILSKDLGLLGFVALGEKRSGARFTLDDADLLNAVVVQAGLAIERLQLQAKLLLEHAVAQRLEDLNRIKSDFVSYVSHELRTPLTSIKMFAELLGGRVRAADRKAKDYLQVIEGESDRLDRMVTTILDSASIEQGVMKYNIVLVDIRTIADRVMAMMRYQLNRQGFRVNYRRGRSPLRILADPDAVADAMMNLIGNSIKYSSERKYLALTLTKKTAWVNCSVRDRGRGISRESIPHLFERFYRDPNTSLTAEGVGLGLPLVKHIMDAHGGCVDVHSVRGKGSTIILKFPAGAGTNS